jgi:hypothetical protein
MQSRTTIASPKTTDQFKSQGVVIEFTHQKIRYDESNWRVS